MAWHTITIDDLRSQLDNGTLTAAQETAQADGQADPVVNQIDWVTQLVRGVARRRVTPEASGVPPALVGAAVDIIVYRLLLRVQPEIAEKRKPAHDQAVETLRLVGDGTLDITETGPAGVPTILGNERENSRTNMDGM